MRILVIANPISGGGRSGRRAERLVRRVEARGHEVELRWTRRRGQAAEMAASVDPQTARLVVVGGDGTLNEVLNGLPDPARVPLVQLATGTANILAHDLKLPYDAERVADLIEHGTIRRLDMGLVGERRFLMLVSCGFDAQVVHDIEQTRVGTLGYAAYLRPILRTLRVYRRPKLAVRVDEGEPIVGEWVVASNTRNYGGLFTVADRARCDSGQLDVCVLERATVPRLARTVVHGLTGGLSGRAGIVYRTGRVVHVESADPCAVQVDGDYLGSTPVRIELRPAVVPFVVGPNGAPRRDG